MSSWILFWKVVCAVGLAGFYLLVLALIPAGLRDLTALFRTLRDD